MKHEETSDLAAILVEPMDDKMSVVRHVSKLQKPVVVVLSPHATLRRPGDLLELRRATSHLERPLMLVIEGNERLRTWAHRQGFAVFASPQTCAKALTRQRITQPLLDLQRESQSGIEMQGSGELRALPRNTEPLAVSRRQRVSTTPQQKRRSEWLLLLLIILLVLGILGGIGFGYLFSVAHTVPALRSPAAFSSFQARF